MLPYSDLMTRYRGRIRSEGPPLQSGRSTCTSLAEHTERIHVFVPPVVSQATKALLAWERPIRAEPMPPMPTADARRIDSDEGRGG